MTGEHDLGVITRGAVTADRVVADQIRLPLHPSGVHIDQQRRIAGHDDDVTISLHTRHPGRISQRGAEVGCWPALARRPLAYEDLRPVAVVLVAVTHVAKKSSW